MKLAILLSILFDLLSRRRVTANYLSEKYDVSPRTVYRYIDILAEKVPVSVKRGRNGGICVSDSYKLPVGFMTEEEYGAAIEALERTYAERPEERFLNARSKLSHQLKSESRDLTLSGENGNLLLDSGVWSDARSLSAKTRLVEECLRDKKILDVTYLPPEGELSELKIEPHVLVFHRNAWYTYAFCHQARAFRLYCLGRMFSVLRTEETFRRRPFKREDIPLASRTDEKTLNARFEVAETVLEKAREQFGIENLTRKKGRWQLSATLPDDETLLYKLLSFGAGLKILEPESLKERVRALAMELVSLYP